MIPSSLALKGLLAATLLTWPALAQANIGDDIKELRARYGGAKDMGNQMLFQHDGYSIAVYFDGSHSAMEVFVRDGSIPSKVDITQDDIDRILISEGGQCWDSVQSNSGKPTWISADHRLIARLSVGDNPGDKFLTVMVNSK